MSDSDSDKKGVASGLYPKFIVTKSNGVPIDDFLFVLRPERDIHAVRALESYVASLEAEQPGSKLAVELREKLQQIQGKSE